MMWTELLPSYSITTEFEMFSDIKSCHAIYNNLIITNGNTYFSKGQSGAKINVSEGRRGPLRAQNPPNYCDILM